MGAETGYCQVCRFWPMRRSSDITSTPPATLSCTGSLHLVEHNDTVSGEWVWAGIIRGGLLCVVLRVRCDGENCRMQIPSRDDETKNQQPRWSPVFVSPVFFSV